SSRFGLNGRYEESLLKTTTVVGIELLRLPPPKRSLKDSRNCSSFVAAFRMSFSEALPIRKKFFERTCSHSSFAEAAAGINTNTAANNRATKENLRVNILLGSV